jgi:hypothetical protein
MLEPQLCDDDQVCVLGWPSTYASDKYCQQSTDYVGQVSELNAVNNGQKRGNFDVAIAGSNGYVTTQLSTPVGYQSGVPYGKFAINAPYDAQGYNTYMGAKMFTGVWSVAQCSQYCDAQTKYNLATAPKDGTPAKVCKFFNTYLLTAKMADGQVVPQGQYCSLYTEAWPIKYATNGGQWRGQDQYTVDYSFGYAKTDASVDPLVGDAKGATYQAVADIKWSKLQPFCSAYLGYSIPLSTYTSTATTVPVVTSVAYSVTTTTVNSNNAKRALSVPADLSKYPASVISSACSMQATQATSTSVVTAFATSTAAASTTIVTSVSTVTTSVKPTSTSFKLVVSAPGMSFDGALIGTQSTPSDGTESAASDLLFLYQGATTGDIFTMDYATSQVSVMIGGSKYILLAAKWQNGVFPLAKFSNSDNVGTDTRGPRDSCTFDSVKGLICGGDYFSLCSNDINLHFANYLRDSQCAKYAIVPVSVS